ncbi:uncharacterized protein B0H18DRAFT_1125858 [Fomitopsis serialis]|uniref:uncharacterized protein n=1 Tax=Fomitopsis serialis TaxID=139415 RepID=UPI0020081EAA|nr:uncharacterized protein B0H18DRAFT_1125858 [Neoantrodia serialis]KAH9914050.1 hypothetical protein B0H18DRAFT_1125858 [Neoantrodia serialis]
MNAWPDSPPSPRMQIKGVEKCEDVDTFNGTEVAAIHCYVKIFDREPPLSRQCKPAPHEYIKRRRSRPTCSQASPMSSPSPSVSALSQNVFAIRSGRDPDNGYLVFYVADYRLGSHREVVTIDDDRLMRPGRLVFLPVPGGRYAFFCCGLGEVRGRSIGLWNVRIVVQEPTLTIYWLDEVADRVCLVTMYDDESFRTLVRHCFGGSGDGAISQDVRQQGAASSQGAVSSQSTELSWRRACGLIALYLVALYLAYKFTAAFISVTTYM